MIPLERYRELVGALGAERESLLDSYWLRFAAQAAVLCPDRPQTLAERIRHLATGLFEGAAWYQSLATPLRFAVAAMLIQHHLPVREFIGDHARTLALLRDVGLRHHDFHATIAALIMHMAPGPHAPGLLQVERIKVIYGRMKGFHWWLTGPEDLPACAALAQCPGDAEAVVARAEDAYQQLHGAGLARGDHLQTAANLLPLSGLPIDRAVDRYRGLKERLEQHTGVLEQEHYEALSLLAMLDHEPEAIVARLLAVRGELDIFQPEMRGTPNLVIATDLTFLDLVRFDRAQQPISEPAAVEAMLRAIHVFHLVSAVLLSQADIDLTIPLAGQGVPGWPYPYA